jgi:hypothetical protein
MLQISFFIIDHPVYGDQLGKIIVSRYMGKIIRFYLFDGITNEVERSRTHILYSSICVFIIGVNKSKRNVLLFPVPENTAPCKNQQGRRIRRYLKMAHRSLGLGGKRLDLMYLK